MDKKEEKYHIEKEIVNSLKYELFYARAYI